MICKIEKLVFHNEEVWMIKISEKAVPDIIVQFAALHLGVIETMMLIDKATGCTIHIYHDAKESKVKYKIGLNKEQHPISQTSLEAMVKKRMTMNKKAYHLQSAIMRPQKILCNRQSMTV